ncbi:MAG: hypothetical protein U0Q22_18125 [Acidimicrobiales bacterium]
MLRLPNSFIARSTSPPQPVSTTLRSMVTASGTRIDSRRASGCTAAMPAIVIVAKPLGWSATSIAVIESATRLGGANATVPTSVSLGRRDAASSRANSAAWPPWEWPQTANRLPTTTPGSWPAAVTMSSTARPSDAPSKYGCRPGVPRPA